MQPKARTGKEDAGAPRLGPVRPAFGLAKDQGHRIEITLVMRNGGLITTVEEMDEPLTDEIVREFSEQLAKDIASGTTRTFADSWTASGQRAWVILREVVAFSTRPAK